MTKLACPDFNLVDDPWILVVMDDGSTREVSLKEAFHKAPEISCLTGDIPQQSALVLRVLEAILYRAYYLANKDVKTHPAMIELWQTIWKSGSFDDMVIDSYLEAYHGRFSLFGDAPFMQVPNLEYASKDKEYDPISEMITDVPKPDKFLFSMRAKSGLLRLSFPEAARWLLCVQGYDCAGIKTPVVGNTHAKSGKVHAPKGLPGIGWSGSIGTTYLEGDALFETLLYNFVMFNESQGCGDYFGIEDDLPSWERCANSHDVVPFVPAGPASLLTVNSRRMRLVTDGENKAVVGVVQCYGDIVRPTEASKSETMTSWRESQEQQRKLGLAAPPLMPCTFDCSKSLWRGLGPILSSSQEAGKPDLRPSVVRWVEMLRDEEVEGLPKTTRVHAQGVEYGPQSSVVANAYDDALDLGDAMLRTDCPAIRCAIDTVSCIDKAVDRFVMLVRDLEKVVGDRRKDKEPLAKRESDDIRERAYLSLDPVARRRLRDFVDSQPPAEYCREWREESRSILLRLGREYVSSFPAPKFAYRSDGGKGQTVDAAWRRFISGLNRDLELDSDR
ncbi:type I-E CRISPR-associated protein Cse1/CasA [Paratractidigestivibacter sp.]|uniref:type I-E CRISPR-associated protein Cse1/CasA n=1 Tax=Paratractidigestivibacter sp. TaxID=2847316 RepID=UPI002ACB178B|nr:type I-E CRISPR-associated protein Cse1/CasA [Paratractidigestivibacter sp.]